jgi:hypothetical protein
MMLGLEPDIGGDIDVGCKISIRKLELWVQCEE